MAGIYIGNTKIETGVPETADYTTLSALTGMVNGDLVYVTADDIKGVFKYDSTLSATNDFGIVREGWVRQFEGDIQAEWFDAGGDDDFNLNFALVAAGATPVKVNKNITINSAILIDSNQTLDLTGIEITPSDPMTSNTVITNRNKIAGDTNIKIIGGEVVGTGYTGTTYNVVDFENVTDSVIEGTIATDVSIIAASDSGNFLFTDCSNIIVDGVEATGTWRAGVYFLRGNNNSILNSYFNATRDSGIIMVDSDYGKIIGNLVDNCGQGSAPNGASNIAANMRYGIFKDNISINAGGTVNGNGFTLGHPLGYDANDTIIEGNIFAFNATKGLFLQGANTTGNTISNNIFLENGVGSVGTNSSGLGIAGGTKNVISNNTFDGNRYAISVDTGQADNLIVSNIIKNSTEEGIRDAGTRTRVQNNQIKDNVSDNLLIEASANGGVYINNNEETEVNFTIKADSSTDLNRFSNALQRFSRTDQGNNTSVGFSMLTSLTNLYGMHFRTERISGGTDFKYVISAHKNTEAGVDIFEIDDDGLVIIQELILDNLPTHADEAAAVTAGLTTNTVYKTTTGELRIKL